MTQCTPTCTSPDGSCRATEAPCLAPHHLLDGQLQPGLPAALLLLPRPLLPLRHHWKVGLAVGSPLGAIKPLMTRATLQVIRTVGLKGLLQQRCRHTTSSVQAAAVQLLPLPAHVLHCCCSCSCCLVLQQCPPQEPWWWPATFLAGAHLWSCCQRPSVSTGCSSPRGAQQSAPRQIGGKTPAPAAVINQSASQAWSSCVMHAHTKEAESAFDIGCMKEKESAVGDDLPLPHPRSQVTRNDKQPPNIVLQGLYGSLAVGSFTVRQRHSAPTPSWPP